METLAQTPDTKIAPQSHHYAKLIECLTIHVVSQNDNEIKSPLGAPQRAQALLEHMEDLYAQAKLPENRANLQNKWMYGVKPDTECYNNVMKAWVSSKEPMFASRAQTIFDRLEQNNKITGALPNVESYSMAIEAWCSSKENVAVFKATNMLKRMEDFVQKYKLNIGDVEKSGDIDSSIRKEDPEPEIMFCETCYPTLQTYKSVLQSLAQSREKTSAEKANAVLNKMEHHFQTKATTIKPDVECYQLVLQTWSKSKSTSAAYRAAKLLSRMEDNQLRPDQSCFTYVIDLLAEKSGSNDAAVKADAALLRMEKLYITVDDSVKPTWNQYHDVISAWAKNTSIENAAERAVQVIDRMEELPNETNDGALISPNTQIYTTAIKAFRNSSSPFINKAREAYSLYQRMMDEYLSGNEEAKPDILSFNCLLEVCASAKNGEREIKNEAFQIAAQAFQDFREANDFGPVNNMTYRLILECCSNLLPPGKKQVQAIERIFQNCCRDGLVDEVVLGHLRQWVPFTTYKRILGNKVDGLQNTLPAKWSRNFKNKTTLYANGVEEKPLETSGIICHKMQGLREKRNQKLLRGGRI